MKNTERQDQLDVQKYFDGIKHNRDMSGLMEYCRYCNFKDKHFFVCSISQDKRIKDSACAKAFNKMTKIRK